jgi:hypothetical protein
MIFPEVLVDAQNKFLFTEVVDTLNKLPVVLAVV